MHIFQIEFHDFQQESGSIYPADAGKGRGLLFTSKKGQCLFLTSKKNIKKPQRIYDFNQQLEQLILHSKTYS